MVNKTSCFSVCYYHQLGMFIRAKLYCSKAYPPILCASNFKSTFITKFD